MTEPTRQRDHSATQIDANGRLRHLLCVEGLKRATIEALLDTAESLLALTGQSVKKRPTLNGRLVANLFFEASTRTRSTFEIAAKRLSADVLNLNIATSATNKGESLLDTLRNLEAMACDIFIVRHEQAGMANFFARHAAPGVSVINAGDGRHAHPTQALLDMLTIRREKGPFHKLRVAIIGDILHSRVARSEIMALNILGVQEIRVIAPKTLLPPQVERLGVRVFHDLAAGLDGADVVITLRLQRERMQTALLPSAREYFQLFGLTAERLALAAPEAIVMHPGPINRGVEIDSAVADGPQSVILKQVTYGIAVRMAVLSMTAQTPQELIYD